MHDELKRQLTDFIARNRLRDFFATWQERIDPDSPLNQNFHQLRSNHEDLESKSMMGVLRSDEAQVRRNQLVSGLLALTAKIAADDLRGARRPTVVAEVVTPAPVTVEPVQKPVATSAAEPAAPPQTTAKSKGAPPWWLITVVATVVTFCLAWWMLASAKIAAGIAVIVGLWLFLRNPELIYQRLALTAMGLVVVLNAINFSGFLSGKVGEQEFRVEMTEPSIVVSLGLLVFAGYMMYLHSRR